MSSEPPPPYDQNNGHQQPGSMHGGGTQSDPNFVDNGKFAPAPYPPGPPPPHMIAYAPQTQMAYPQQPQNVGGVPPSVVPMVPVRAVFVQGMVFGPYPTNMTCGNCHSQIVTQTVTRAGLLAWLICGALVLFGCWLGCCLIPFCVDDCQDVDHICPNCKAMVGSYRRI